MAFENYQVWSWMTYLLSALVVMIVTLRITRSWPVTLRGFIVTTATALFAVPWYIQGDSGPMAPAVIVTFFEALSAEPTSSWMRAGIPLMGALALCYFLLALFLWFKNRAMVETTAEAEQAAEQA